MRRERSILINAAPDAVFDYVSDVMRHPEWAAQKIEMRHVAGPESGAGAEFSATVHFVMAVQSSLKVLEVTRPSRFVYECQDSSGRYKWAFDLRPEDGGTRLTQSFDRLDAPLYMRIMQPLIYPLLGKGMFDKGLAGIKAHVEGSTATASA